MGIFAQVEEKQKSGNVFSNAKQEVKPNYGDAVKESFDSSINYANQGADQARNGGIIDKGEGLLKFGSGLIGAATAPIAPVINATVGKGIQFAADNISDIPAVQKFAISPAGETTSRIAEDVGNAATIAGTVLGGPKVAATTGGIAADAGALAKAAVTKTPEELAIANTLKSQKAVNTITKEWERPVKTPSASFNKARLVIDQSPDVPKFLAQQGIKPSSLIEDSRYSTEDTATALRDTAGKMSNDTLRPSLKAADYSTPKTQIGDLEEAAIHNAQRTPNVTAGNMESIIQNIKDESDALKNKFPNGMSLTDMHDYKITYAKNGGYSPFNDPKINNAATANRSFSSALGHAVENRAPKDVPVHEFNDYLSKYYQGADYLDALNTKTAPVTLPQALIRSAAKFGGAAVGAKLGGDVVSAFAGYQIGKALEHALENMKPHMRDSFVRNLQQTNPEAFTKVQEYLNRQNSGNTGVPRLMNSGTVYVPPYARAPGESTVTSVSAVKGPVGFDPKSGKFKSTYLSGPK